MLRLETLPPTAWPLAASDVHSFPLFRSEVLVVCIATSLYSPLLWLRPSPAQFWHPLRSRPHQLTAVIRFRRGLPRLLTFTYRTAPAVTRIRSMLMRPLPMGRSAL